MLDHSSAGPAAEQLLTTVLAAGVVISDDDANALLNRVRPRPVLNRAAHLYPAEAYIRAADWFFGGNSKQTQSAPRAIGRAQAHRPHMLMRPAAPSGSPGIHPSS
jgi:hypothetical protein